MYNNYSVLMSVYKNDNPVFFKESIDSMLNQTVVTNDFVIVCDGPLSDRLNEVICYYCNKYPKLFNIVRIKFNSGLGLALQRGIRFCTNVLVARMDSDDLSVPNRCELQLNVFNKNKNIDIVGGIIEEFDGSIDNIVSKREVPENNDEILKFSKLRSPFSHMSVMFKKESVLAAGNYQDFYHVEDYYLWIRMLSIGFIGYNIQQTLVLVRAGEDMFRRRGGFDYYISQMKLLKFMRQTEYIKTRQYLLAVGIRTIQALSPNKIREFIYIKFLRKGVNE